MNYYKVDLTKRKYVVITYLENIFYSVVSAYCTSMEKFIPHPALLYKTFELRKINA